MYPSSRYNGLCVSTQTIYTPTRDIITQNTYTIRSERINPTVYRTVKTRYAQPQTTAIQAYQRALQAYQNPNQSYESAQQHYQIALQAYAAAYQPAYRPTNRYNWAAYFG